jgi:cell division septal protein FtsQ
MLTDEDIVQILRDSGHHPTMLADDEAARKHLLKCPTVQVIRMAYNRGLLDARRDPK